MTMMSATSATAPVPAPLAPISLANAISLLDQAASAIGGDAPLARDRISAARDILLGNRIEAPRAMGSGLAPWQTKRIIAHIEAHLEDTIANDELAALINLSTGHFTRAFRQTFNTTPHAYVLDRRVELAAEMMTGSDEKLAIIAASCGFHDQSHLSRIFRRAKGVTPAVWRRRHAAFAMAQA